jgi:transcriptional regulator with XRE-family HTH domain
MTQSELAVVAGVSERTIRNAEAGHSIRVDFLRFLAIALGVEPTYVAANGDALRAARLSEQNVARILSAVQTYAMEHDIRGYRELLAPDALIRLPGPPEIPFVGEYRGPDGMQELNDIVAPAITWDEMPVMTDIRASGNFVLIQFTDHSRINSTGLEYSSLAQYIFEFENGRVKKVDNFFDTYAMMEAFHPSVRRSARKTATVRQTAPQQTVRIRMENGCMEGWPSRSSNCWS